MDTQLSQVNTRRSSKDTPMPPSPNLLLSVTNTDITKHKCRISVYRCKQSSDHIDDAFERWMWTQLTGGSSADLAPCDCCDTLTVPSSGVPADAGGPFGKGVVVIYISNFMGADALDEFLCVHDADLKTIHLYLPKTAQQPAKFTGKSLEAWKEFHKDTPDRLDWDGCRRKLIHIKFIEGKEEVSWDPRIAHKETLGVVGKVFADIVKALADYRRGKGIA